MNQGLFSAQINTAWNILSKLQLASGRQWYPGYPDHPAAEFGLLAYVDLWKSCFSNQYYDFSLIDGSLIQFRAYSFRPLRVSYAFLECPFEGGSYLEFVQTELGLDVRDAGDLFQEAYENYLLSCPSKESVTPIRYDYDPDCYTEGLHPASHVHFGCRSSIRIGTARVLRPLSFVLFIVRQCYNQEWKQLLGMNETVEWCRNVRESLEEIHSQYVNALDRREMILV